MNRAALEPGVGEGFINRFQQPQAFVPDEQLCAGKTPFPEPLEELLPASLVLFHPLRSTDHLPVTVLIYCHGDKNRYVSYVPPQLRLR